MYKNVNKILHITKIKLGTREYFGTVPLNLAAIFATAVLPLLFESRNKVIKRKASDTGLTHIAWLGFAFYATQAPGKAMKKSWATRFNHRFNLKSWRQ